jgi:RHH-type rel operon transcriptional repressor/antitoxin RelB
MVASKPIAVRLPLDLEARLAALASKTGRTTTFYVRAAVEAYLDELEEHYWAHEALVKWQSEGKKSRPIDELWNNLGV